MLGLFLSGCAGLRNQIPLDDKIHMVSWKNISSKTEPKFEVSVDWNTYIVQGVSGRHEAAWHWGMSDFETPHPAKKIKFGVGSPFRPSDLWFYADFTAVTTIERFLSSIPSTPSR